MAKRFDQIDKHLGARVRMRRVMLKMSQETVAARLKVSFQQLQKYERGETRIGAGSLWHLADLFEVPVTFFFEGLPETHGASRSKHAVERSALASRFFSDAHAIELAEQFSSLKDTGIRRLLVDVARAIARAR